MGIPTSKTPNGYLMCSNSTSCAVASFRLPPFRQLRNLCRYYVKLTSCMIGEKDLAQNCLTVSNFKLDGVLSNVFGKSASTIIDYMLEHPGEKLGVAPFVHWRCKTPIKQIQEAVNTDFEPMQAERLKINVVNLKLKV